MSNFENNPLINLTGLWVNDGQLGCKAGLTVASVEGEGHDFEIRAGDAVLGRMWNNDKGKAKAGGSFLNLRCMLFKNDGSGENQPAYSLVVCKRDDRPQQAAGAGPSAGASSDRIPF